MGVACLGIALLAALQPVAPIPAHVAASASAAPSPRLQRPAAVFPTAAVTGSPHEFRWQANDAEGPFTVVLLDAGYAELARCQAIDATAVAAAELLATPLASGATYHWYVVGSGDRAGRQSLFESFVVH